MSRSYEHFRTELTPEEEERVRYHKEVENILWELSVAPPEKIENDSGYTIEEKEELNDVFPEDVKSEPIDMFSKFKDSSFFKGDEI